jgi:uncharacterized protein YegJ (DUF2314 family)
MKGSVLIFSLLVVCSTFAQTSKTERAGEPNIYYVEGEDKAMNEAIKKSRQAFGGFLKAFKNKTINQSSFSVKMPFAAGDSDEHIWLGNISLIDDKLTGEINNLPENIQGLEPGDIIEIDQKKISDWFYIDNGKLIGGYTIRVLRGRMSPSEKEEFDRVFPVKY